MSIQLRIDEMLEALHHAESPMFETFKTNFEFMATQMGQEVARVLDLKTNGEATFEGLALDGICMPFAPKTKDQSIPVFLREYEIETSEFKEMQDAIVDSDL